MREQRPPAESLPPDMHCQDWGWQRLAAVHCFSAAPTYSPSSSPPSMAGDYRITTSQSYDPVIASVPVMALVALAGFLSLYLIRQVGA